MNYEKLGNSNIEVSKLCVGCMSFGVPSEDFHRWTLNQEDSTAMVKKALDLGINFFDTANITLTDEDIAYLEEMYMPHKIVGAL